MSIVNQYIEKKNIMHFFPPIWTADKKIDIQ